jgi:hypothetical protein
MILLQISYRLLLTNYLKKSRLVPAPWYPSFVPIFFSYLVSRSVTVAERSKAVGSNPTLGMDV